LKIAICKSNENIKSRYLNKLENKFSNNDDWSQRFSKELDRMNYNHEIINIDKNNWIDEIKKYDLLFWKPKFMGLKSSQNLKEKIYFMDKILSKKIVPNYETIWHFDSKIAQNYIFNEYDIPSPKTFCTFDFNEAIKFSNECNYPIIYKKSNGAGGTNVRKINSKFELKLVIFKKFILNRILGLFIEKDRFGRLYLQEFIDDNNKDLRITVIGDCYAYSFWRLNRENDFRASGSGKIDYEQEVPEEIIRYCIKMNRKFNFDSMAYDIIFKNGEFVIVEMSYGYVDTALYNAPGYYELDKENNLNFIDGNYWPQKLWIKWGLGKHGKKY
jgi:glutathione synthase/RimK-type ligase-like ATP-grasp enzyme